MPKSKVKEQWAAIVWKSKNSEKINKKGEASLYDIVDLTCVPKKYRTEGCIASLKWVDTSTGKTSYHKAEVLKISSDKEALELLCINSNTGKISDPSEKIFSSEVLDKKKEEQQGKKIKKIAQNKASTQVAAEIAKDTSIFDDTSVNDTSQRSFETVSSLTPFSALPSTATVNSPSLTVQETHSPLTTSNAFSVLHSTATVNSPLTLQETYPPLTTSNAFRVLPSTATVNSPLTFQGTYPPLTTSNAFKVLPSTATVNSPLTLQETHPPLTTSNAFSVLPSTATVNSPLTSQGTHPPLTTSNAFSGLPSTATVNSPLTSQGTHPPLTTSNAFSVLPFTATVNSPLTLQETYPPLTTSNAFSVLPSTATVNSSLTFQETYPPLTTSNAFRVLPSTATVNSPLTSQGTHPPLTTSNAFSGSSSTATVNYCPSTANEFGCKLAPTAQSTQALLPSSCTSFTDLNTYSPEVTENSQWFPTMTTPPLPLPTQQYIDKSTAQELWQSKHRSTSQASQSSEALQSCSQLPDSKDKLKRFMDAFMALGPEVTETNIRFFENVVTAMKSTYIPENFEASKESSFKISDFYKSPGKGKVEIYPGTNFYFYESIKANIMDKSKVLDQQTSERVNHWPLLVRHALIEVYGKNLALFCAKGSKKDGRPGIDAQFYKALYYWACDWNGGKITEEKFIDNINKAAYNKRKARNQAEKILKIPKKDAETHPKPGATDNQTTANIA
ncbi:uncharacterized protein [Temnothorax longispinosus]|uniref:uncharacterized protein n=1 Tax=Temnothorax longispinosus TaxID=300112 RepID=UPI003A99A168